MKKSIKIIMSVLIMMLIHQLSIGQNESGEKEISGYRNALGIAAGFTTGYGLSYRYTPARFGIQTTFAPYKDDYTSHYCIGVTFIYNLFETEKVNFYLYQANSYRHTKSKDFYSNYNGWPETKSVTEFFNNGIGFGLEFIFLRRVSFNLMGGYGAYNDFERLSLTGETGLYFKC